MTDRDLLAEIDALRAELTAQQRTIPALPDEHDGHAITWRPWLEAPVALSHLDNGCHQCDHPGPQMLAFGLTTEPDQRGPRIRYHAFRCPACQEMRVSRRHPVIEEIAYHPPQAASAPPAPVSFDHPQEQP